MPQEPRRRTCGGCLGPQASALQRVPAGVRWTLQRLQKQERDPHTGQEKGGRAKGGLLTVGGGRVLKAQGRLPLDLRNQPCFPRDEWGTTVPTIPGPWGTVLPSKLPDVWLRNASPSPLCSIQEQKGKASE